MKAAASVSGALLGLAVGILVADGRWSAAAACVLFGVAAVAVARRISAIDRDRTTYIVGLSYALHVTVAVLLNTWSLAVGRGGFIPGDDGAYAMIASHFVRYLQGIGQPPWVPPFWAGEAYLFGTWVYLESAIFLLVGPEVLVPILLNCALAVTGAVLASDIARRVFDRRSGLVALVLVAFFPSLLLWSSLNLKDALAFFLVSVCLWALVRFHERPRLRMLALAVAVLVPLDSLRHYLYVGLAILIPATILMTPALRFPARARWTGAAAAASVALMLAGQGAVVLGPGMLSTFEEVRRAMAIGARTAYVETPPLAVKEGDTFVIGSNPTFPDSPVGSPRIVHVDTGSRIALSEGGTPVAGTVYVRPGDVVVVGGPSTTPNPNPSRLTVREAAPAIFTASRGTEDDFARRTLSHLPVGASLAVFGPFPWMLTRTLDLAVLPDLAAWYVVAVASAVTMVSHRARWTSFAAVAAVELGVLGLLALTEGNWGTMFRHRGMVIPWAAVLAAPTLSRLMAMRDGSEVRGWR